MKYNIGAGNHPLEGFVNLDMGDDITLTGKRAELIYTSHFLEYFDKTEVLNLLKCWYFALADGGELYISVPDFAKVVDIYNKEGIIMDGALYGKMNAGIEVTTKYSKEREFLPGNNPIYHKSTFDRKTLREALLLAGFRNIKEFEPWHNDCSQDPISLNLQCRK